LRGRIAAAGPAWARRAAPIARLVATWGTNARAARRFWHIRIKSWRQTMRRLLIAGAGILTAMASPIALAAPDPAAAGGSATDVAEMDKRYERSPAQEAIYGAWPNEQRMEYDAWPYDYQVYYWTLDPVQQSGYWALTPDQRGMIYKMWPDQRAKAWSSIRQQLAGQVPTTPAGQANPPGMGMPTTGVPDPDNAAQAVRPAMPAGGAYQGGPYKGALTPPPAEAMNKDYPICSKTVQDSCRNPGGV